MTKHKDTRYRIRFGQQNSPDWGDSPWDGGGKEKQGQIISPMIALPRMRKSTFLVCRRLDRFLWACVGSVIWDGVL